MLTATFALFFALLGLPLILLDAVWLSRRASRMRNEAREQRAMLAFDRAEGELWDLVADKALPTVPKHFAVEILRGFRDAAVFVSIAPTLVTLSLMARILDRYEVRDPRAHRFLYLLDEGMRLLVSESFYSRIRHHPIFRRHKDDDDDFHLHGHSHFQVEQERQRDAVAR